MVSTPSPLAMFDHPETLIGPPITPLDAAIQRADLDFDWLYDSDPFVIAQIDGRPTQPVLEPSAIPWSVVILASIPIIVTACLGMATGWLVRVGNELKGTWKDAYRMGRAR